MNDEVFEDLYEQFLEEAEAFVRNYHAKETEIENLRAKTVTAQQKAALAMAEYHFWEKGL
tara:strand:+ start:10571 stop:10750 length:180 start_codon:yes stop_codon:yes gene_type:complete